MSQDKSGKQGRTYTATQWARLVRFTEDQRLSEDVRLAVRSRMLEELGAFDINAAVPQPEREIARPVVEKAPARAPAAQSSPPVRDAAQLELKIRQLVEADAPFAQLEPLVWQLFTAKPTGDAGARILELAFLHGSTAETELVIAKLKSHCQGFYRHVHPAVRAHLVVRFWREGVADSLATVVFRDRDEAWLQPIERLFVFQSMAVSRDASSPYIYFRRYRRELFEAACELGAHVGLTPARFLLAVGKMAIDLGHEADARELLEQIRPGDPERDEALRLLLDQAVDKNKSGRSHYTELLFATADPSERVRLIGQFLGATRGLGGFKDRNRPALNELLRVPLDQLGEAPEAWSTLSELIIASRDLEPLLPNLFEVFRTSALKFHSPLLDGALWQGPLAMNPATPRDRYWHGVALLHHYVTTGATNERALWKARELVLDARRDWQQAIPFQWKDLHKAAQGWIAKNHYLMETDRARMLKQLRVALDADQVVTSDVEDYLESAEAPPFEVLAALQTLAATKRAPQLEGRIILKRAQVGHLTNDDLNRLWQLAGERKDNDLAWRVATVVHARGSLSQQVRYAWDMSGEKRSHYGMVAPTKQAIERCLKGIPARAARLAYASLHVGPLLPELLSMLDPGASVAKVVAPPSDSVEAKVDKMLGELSWLEPPKRRYRFSFEATLGGTSVPQFMQVLPANPWSVLVARLAERLGINAWGWRLSRLHDQIVDLIPRLASRQDLRRHSGKVSSWLKKLTPEQRAAWQDLANLSRSLEDDRAADALAMFVCRMATVMLQNHHMALTSLHAMRASAAVIWDLESWIVSEPYSELRQKLGTFNRVPVPNALQRLATIVT